MSWLYPRQCTTTYPTPAAATRRGISASARPPLTSLTSCAPASSANSATRARIVDALGPRPGGLAAHVHDVRALRGQVQAVRDGRVRPVPLAAVGERVGR